MDFATSAVAMGKIKLAEARGQEIPLGWVVDKDGDLTTDPAKIKGGALMPLGGTEGYKGTALAAMGEIFCGILTGLGFGVEPSGRHNDGCFLIAIKVEAFRPLLTFRKDVADFAALPEGHAAGQGQPGRALSRRGRAPGGTGTRRGGYRDRGRHLEEARRAGRGGRGGDAGSIKNKVGEGKVFPPRTPPFLFVGWHLPRGGCRLTKIDEGSGENTFSPAFYGFARSRLTSRINRCTKSSFAMAGGDSTNG